MTRTGSFGQVLLASVCVLAFLSCTSLEHNDADAGNPTDQFSPGVHVDVQDSTVLDSGTKDSDGAVLEVTGGDVLDGASPIDCGVGHAFNPVTMECECKPNCTNSDTGEPYECGDDGCGGSCGDCGWCSCEDRHCTGVPDCEGKECGSDSCGGSCGECTDGFICDPKVGLCQPVCDPNKWVFDGDFVQKVVAFDLGFGGYPHEALDLDDNDQTCSPDGGCQGGYDNMMSGLDESLLLFDFSVSGALADALASGRLVLLIETQDWNSAAPFSASVHFGEEVDLAQCDVMQDCCDYRVVKDSFNPVSCDAPITFDDCVFDGAALRCGFSEMMADSPSAMVRVPGKESSIPGEEFVTFEVFGPRLYAEVVAVDDGMRWTNGVFAGAVRRPWLGWRIVDLLPAAFLEGRRDAAEYWIVNAIDLLLGTDMDAEGYGILYTVSFGLTFSTIPGRIVGLAVE